MSSSEDKDTAMPMPVSAPDAAEASPPSMRSILKKPDVKTLIFSRMATMLGIATLSYGSMVFLAQTGAGQMEISLMGMTRYASALIFGLGGGMMADAMSKRGALFSAYAIQAALCFLIPLVLGTGVPALFAVVFVSAMLGQITVPAIKSAVTLVATPAEVASASALISVAGGIAAAAGSSFLAPLLIELGGIRAVMFASGAILLFGAVRARHLPEEEGKVSLWKAFDSVEWKSTFPSLRGTAGWLFEHKGAGSMILSGALILALFDGINSLMPVYIRDVLGIDPVNAVFVMAPGALGFVAGTFLGPALIHRFGERAVTAVGLVAMFGGAVGYFFIDALTPVLAPVSPLRTLELFGADLPPKVLAASFLAIPTALGSTLGGAAVQTYINRRVPVERQGSTFGRQELIENGLTLFMIALLGVLGTLLGPKLVFLVAPIVLFAVVVFLVQYAYRVAGEAKPTFRQAADALVEFRDLDVDAPPIDPGPRRD